MSFLPCVILQTLLLAAAPEVKVRTLAGQSSDEQALTGTLESFSTEGVVVGASGTPVKLPLSGIVEITPAEKPAPTEARPAAWIELTDGTRLLAQSYLVEKGEVKSVLLGGDSVLIPVRLVARVRLKHQTDQIAEQWAQMLAAKASADLLVVRKAEAIDYLEGTLGEVSADMVQFKLDGESVPVKRGKVEGLIYYRPAPEETPASLCQATDTSGGEIAIKDLNLSGDDLQITTPAGARLTRKWNQIARIDFSRGKVVPLADLDIDSLELPSTVGIRPESTRKNAVAFMRPRFDEGPHGDSLRVAGQNFARGVAIQSPTVLKYRIAGKFSRFLAFAGLDDQEPGSGGVQLVIEGDGKTLLDERFTANASPRPIDVDVKGVKLLTLRVEYGDESAVSDCLDLCEARMSK